LVELIKIPPRERQELLQDGCNGWINTKWIRVERSYFQEHHTCRNIIRARERERALERERDKKTSWDGWLAGRRGKGEHHERAFSFEALSIIF
jgi:hypothetical protein